MVAVEDAGSRNFWENSFEKVLKERSLPKCQGVIGDKCRFGSCAGWDMM